MTITNTSLRSLILFILLFLPKIDIIDIPNYWQGIRVDDILIAFYGLYILFTNKEISYSTKNIYKNFIIFFLYACFVSLIGLIFFKTKIVSVMILRILEYLVIIIFFLNLRNNKEYFIRILEVFLLINLLVSILQILGIVGSFSSLGYLSPNHILNQSTYGLLGGSWELAVTSGISFFALFYSETNKKRLFFFFLISLTLIYLSNNRTCLIAFLLSFTIYFFLISKYKNNIYAISLVTICFIFIIFFNFQTLLKYTDIFSQIFNILYKFFANGQIVKLVDFGKYDQSTWSLLYRTWEWQNIRLITQQNDLYYIFGSGLTTLYSDSFLLRIIYNLGILSAIFILYFSLNIPFIFFIFIILVSSTLDIFVSMKIFIFILMFVKIYNITKQKNGFNFKRYIKINNNKY